MFLSWQLGGGMTMMRRDEEMMRRTGGAEGSRTGTTWTRREGKVRHRALEAVLAVGALLVLGTGCISSVRHEPVVRYVALDPQVSTEPGATRWTLSTREGKDGGVAIHLESAQECTVTTQPRYQMTNVDRYVAHGLPGAYTTAGIALAGGAGMIIGGTLIPGGLTAPTSSGSSTIDTKGILIITGSALALVGAIILPIAIYHTAKAGETEGPPSIVLGVPPTGAPVAAPRAMLPEEGTGTDEPLKRSSDDTLAPAGVPTTRSAWLAAPPPPPPPVLVARPRVQMAANGATVKTEVCSRQPGANLKLVLSFRDEAGRRATVDLDKTDDTGSVTVDVLRALKGKYSGWPQVKPLVKRQATLALADDVNSVVGEIDLGEFAELKYDEHERYARTPEQKPEQYDADKEFADLIALFQRKGPSWDKGAGVAARFLIVAKNSRVSQGFYSDEGIERSKDGRSVIFAHVPGKDWWFVIAAKQFQQGHFKCASDLMLGVADTPDFKGSDPRTGWTSNDDGRCQMDVYAGTNPGDLQGRFTGKLVANNKTAYWVVEDGYFYLRAPKRQAGPGPAQAAPQTKIQLPE